MATHLDEPADIECTFFGTPDDVPDPRDLNSTKNNLLIFDDLQLKKQTIVKRIILEGRHSHVDFLPRTLLL